MTITGADIRRLRLAAKVSRHELAPRVNYSADHFSRIERGSKRKQKVIPVAVPKGFGPLVKQALLDILDERKQLIEQADILDES